MTDQLVKFGFVVAELNRDLTYMMEMEAEEHTHFLGANVCNRIYVLGAYDMPLVARLFQKRSDINAVFTIGCAIEGATDHDPIVVPHASRKFIDLSLEYAKQVVLGISGLGLTRLEAEDCIEYGKRVVESAVKMVRRLVA
ncbi:MAG: 6,7-dimethyl-8-ribityllumazine synthase [Methanocalculaceae archaeon]|jgi:6,7-dimethyl-8-ribityllumazine synthase|nr:6,7-dimethyl-8-ribityllumazine synthase [Methanocalculaceae archaeon]